MTPEDVAMQSNFSLAAAQQSQMAAQQANQDYMLQQNERGMIKDQLDLGEELEVIENLLRGNILQDVGDGRKSWVAPKNNEMIVLSEYGIHLVLNTIHWYLNKNTLLSNYDEETINRKMEDFASDLNDTVFMEYEKVFQYPTLDECKETLMDRIQKKKELRKFTLELLGKKYNEEDAEQEFIKEMEFRIEKELTNIKEQIIKNKLKRFLILLRCIQDTVHSTYQRAYGGQERRTLRQHIHVSESRNPALSQQNKSYNPVNMFRQ